ncbi:hypothetical protein MKZ38_001802 [Zalerion maritima]|uniref:SprT-like domain-containing protein n=1 Tax=Zalerion maritima TaxID=339359 RepID=A0AAD5RYZ8_9PEZI|nr:hypothetical protein MKZ38_001802 [Zalerion maritima]
MAPRQCPEWVPVSSHGDPDAQPAFYIRGGKRRVSKTESDMVVLDRPNFPSKRHKSEYAQIIYVDKRPPASQLSSPDFYVIRECGRDESATPPSMAPAPFPRPTPAPVPVAYPSTERGSGSGPAAMERTASGLSIESEGSNYSPSPTPYPQYIQPNHDIDLNLISDSQALDAVRQRMRYMQGLVANRPDSPEARHEFLLRSIIDPRLGEKGWDIDDAALASILIATDYLFFNETLAGRVKWDWSHPDSGQYERSIIGTTALRRRTYLKDVRHGHWSPHVTYDGFETLIVLSQPILRSRDYSRTLLISTFLHELIHCYLFVCCGFEARRDGGHTHAFREIARAIDSWAGVGVLHLGEMEADLRRFRKDHCCESASAMPSSAGTRPVVYMHTRSEIEAPEWRPYNDAKVQPSQGIARDTVWDNCVHDEWDGFQPHHQATSQQRDAWGYRPYA